MRDEIRTDGETVCLAVGADDPDVEKSNYYGSKRRLAKSIVDKFPEDAKTIFDPMCGVSGVLIEAARRGCRVRANDLSTAGFVHWDHFEDITFCCINHGNFSSVVDQIDFSFRGKRRSFVLGAAGRLDSPLHLAC